MRNFTTFYCRFPRCLQSSPLSLPPTPPPHDPHTPITRCCKTPTKPPKIRTLGSHLMPFASGPGSAKKKSEGDDLCLRIDPLTPESNVGVHYSGHRANMRGLFFRTAGKAFCLTNIGSPGYRGETAHAHKAFGGLFFRTPRDKI